MIVFAKRKRMGSCRMALSSNPFRPWAPPVQLNLRLPLGDLGLGGPINNWAIIFRGHDERRAMFLQAPRTRTRAVFPLGRLVLLGAVVPEPVVAPYATTREAGTPCPDWPAFWTGADCSPQSDPAT